MAVAGPAQERAEAPEDMQVRVRPQVRLGLCEPVPLRPGRLTRHRPLPHVDQLDPPARWVEM